MHRSLSVLLTGALLLIGSLAIASGATAATIAPTTTCSNGVDDTPGLGLICEVTVVNTITATGGTAVVTVRECHGAAGNPQAACSVTTSPLTGPVTGVTQCNNAINGGGGTLRCSVTVTNNFIASSPTATAATVNQCVGSGGGITTGCNPFPATTSGATITQCNGSANGGTLVGLTCTATGTASSAASVLVNQCNGSANGGGSLVICSASITNNVNVGPSASASASASASPSVAPSASPSASASASALPSASAAAAPAAGPTARPRVTMPPTNTEPVADPGAPGSPALALIGLLCLLGFAGLVVGAARLRAQSR